MLILEHGHMGIENGLLDERLQLESCVRTTKTLDTCTILDGKQNMLMTCAIEVTYIQRIGATLRTNRHILFSNLPMHNTELS